MADVERILSSLADMGYIATPHDAECAWAEWSGYPDVGGVEWLPLPVTTEALRAEVKRLVDSSFLEPAE